MSRTRRLSGLVGRAVALIVLVALLPGCVQVPRPASPTEAPRPSLTLDRAAEVLRRAHEVLGRADRKLDPATLPAVLGGPALEAARTSYSLSRVGDGEAESTLARFTFVPVALWSTDARRYPQRALVESRLTDRRHPKARVLHRLARADAGAPWLVVQELYPDADRLTAEPTLVTGVAEQLTGDTTVDGLRLSAVGQTLASALNRPGSAAARRFAGDPRRAEFQDLVDRMADLGPRHTTFSAGRDAFWLRAAGGGATGLVPLSFLDTVEARPEHYLTLEAPYDRTHPGQYQQISQAGLATCLVEVPARGRIRVGRCDWTYGHLHTG